MTIYERIKCLCKTKGITVSELERTFKKSRDFYRKWNTSMPNSANLIEIADYFGVSLDYLIGRDEKYSAEQAMLDVEISEDFELKEAIKKYYALDDRKKEHVIELINLLSGE